MSEEPFLVFEWVSPQGETVQKLEWTTEEWDDFYPEAMKALDELEQQESVELVRVPLEPLGPGQEPIEGKVVLGKLDEPRIRGRPLTGPKGGQRAQETGPTAQNRFLKFDDDS